MTDTGPSRREQLATALHTLHTRIDAACSSVGRPPDGVTLVVVTKFFPASDVRLLAELGVRHVGENRHQEASVKREECRDLALAWHFIGQLQSNKAAAVGGWADVVQSVDRVRLLAPLSRAADERGRPLDVLVQVSLDEDRRGAAGDRSGAVPDQVPSLAAEVAAASGLRLRGVMGVAPMGGDPAAAFARLAAAGAQVRAEVPSATWLSAGMSGDLEQAIGVGATHVRVGTAVLGNRPGRV